MFIDISKAKEVFEEYVKEYDLSQQKIKYKLQHTYRVANISRKIAEGLKLDEENIELAELIGLLHDIGRFEQVKLYNTYDDAISIDHADKGVEVLFEDGLIRRFLSTSKYDEIIKIAILNHNKYKIDESITDKNIITHSKIIRDADKTDIFYSQTVVDYDILFNCSDVSKQKISEDIVEGFLEHKTIPYSAIKTPIDNIVNHISFVFDVNYKPSLQIIKNSDYINKTVDRVEYKLEDTRENMKMIKNVANQYIDERLASNNIIAI